MSSEFAFLQEVWGPEINQTTNPSCQLLSKKKGLDNIMDAYMATDGHCDQSNQDPYLKMEKRVAPYDIDTVEGYNVSNPLYSQSFAFNSYYDDDIKASNPVTVDKRLFKEPSPVCMEEANPNPALTREEIYRDIIIEKYGSGGTYVPPGGNSNGSSSGNNNIMEQKDYIELFIYIISGILLIFFMEQILHLGAMMKH